MKVMLDTRYVHLRHEPAPLRAVGQPIGRNDLWIAAHALARDVPLITDNLSEFRPAGLGSRDLDDSVAPCPPRPAPFPARRGSREGRGAGIPEWGLMTTLTIELPDELVEEARTRGLLAPGAMEAMIRDALRRRAVGELFEAADKPLAEESPPMTLAEIQEEVNAVRSERRQRAATVKTWEEP